MFFLGFLRIFDESCKTILQACQNMHCTCQQEHLGKDYLLWKSFHIRYRGKVTWGFSCRRFPACLQQLPSRHRGERFEEKLFPKWLSMIFALAFSEFEQNCFWLLAEKLRHSRQNCPRVYVARFRRKQGFWNYSILYIDVGHWPVFLFSLRTFGQGRRICNQRAGGAIFWIKIWFERSFIWKGIFNPWAKSFRTFWWHLLCGLVRTSF